ncbi:MAG: MBL fold metallo-hydrolase [Clostridiaceae bacterium]|nr:MBL fold metallo-hydrolase [Clostridiaceae bacterium]
MTLSFCSFSSGSSGNCYLIKTEKTAVLVDAGISCKRITEGLEKTGTPKENLRSILVTHEHWDHVDGIKTMMKKYKDISIHANNATFTSMKHEVKDERRRYFVSGDKFTIDDLDIETFRVSHDAADPVGYTIKHENKQISVVTDTGTLEEYAINSIQNSDILVLESNHDVDMLKMGRYSQFLKERILSERGHLSNEAAGHIITSLMKAHDKTRCVLLAHLSQDNNFPEMAEQTVCNILEENNYYNGQDIYVKTINRNEISMVYEI